LDARQPPLGSAGRMANGTIQFFAFIECFSFVFARVFSEFLAGPRRRLVEQYFWFFMVVPIWMRGC
jgi:hypothetical protein